ncbi:hypothetical protein [Actinomycetospora flava]|uniref:Uncharacterized protein n=1 Tax=Actinomycetospora flava TaxID=3129232 RepID=A0ABU8M610_9PSEU
MSDYLRASRGATSADLLAMNDVVRYGARADSDIPTLKDRYARVRLANDVDWPAPVWYFLDELFYVMEEHSMDTRLRAEQGGLDDEGLREAMASLGPTLDEAHERMRAEEEGRDPAPASVTASARTAASELLETVHAFISGAMDTREFASKFSLGRAAALDEFPPRVLASVGIIHRALGVLVPPGQRPRFYDLDEDGLRTRVADVEPRFAEAVAEMQRTS